MRPPERSASVNERPEVRGNETATRKWRRRIGRWVNLLCVINCPPNCIVELDYRCNLWYALTAYYISRLCLNCNEVVHKLACHINFFVSFDEKLYTKELNKFAVKCYKKYNIWETYFKNIDLWNACYFQIHIYILHIYVLKIQFSRSMFIITFYCKFLFASLHDYNKYLYFMRN